MKQQTLINGVHRLSYPLSMLGCQLGRNVTVFELSDGKTLIHSTAEFSNSDVEKIREWGEPAFLLEATNMHDTTSQRGREAFPDCRFLAPKGFPGLNSLNGEPFPDKISDEFELAPIGGAPKLSEYAMLHLPSKTLILADLFFNLPDSATWWTKFFLRTTVGLKTYPGQSRLLTHYIKDEAAYRESIEKISEWDFEQIIVGHGEPIRENAKSEFNRVLGIEAT